MERSGMEGDRDATEDGVAIPNGTAMRTFSAARLTKGGNRAVRTECGPQLRVAA